MPPWTIKAMLAVVLLVAILLAAGTKEVQRPAIAAARVTTGALEQIKGLLAPVVRTPQKATGHPTGAKSSPATTPKP